MSIDIALYDFDGNKDMYEQNVLVSTFAESTDEVAYYDDVIDEQDA